ncbi:hypothetical protein BJ742DRAFT_821979 [Cladochytrium replicatum]|nr:hypothetical protein BJ742DRAFT_821979 [Cladochytrium replicatum]
MTPHLRRTSVVSELSSISTLVDRFPTFRTSTPKHNFIRKMRFTWAGAARQVVVTGEFDNWCATRHIMRPTFRNSSQCRPFEEFELTISIDIRPLLDGAVSNIQFKFVVDGQWHCSPDYPKTISPADGFTNNFVDLEWFSNYDVEDSYSDSPSARLLSALRMRIPYEDDFKVLVMKRPVSTFWYSEDWISTSVWLERTVLRCRLHGEDTYTSQRAYCSSLLHVVSSFFSFRVRTKD